MGGGSKIVAKAEGEAGPWPRATQLCVPSPLPSTAWGAYGRDWGGRLHWPAALTTPLVARPRLGGVWDFLAVKLTAGVRLGGGWGPLAAVLVVGLGLVFQLGLVRPARLGLHAGASVAVFAGPAWFGPLAQASVKPGGRRRGVGCSRLD